MEIKRGDIFLANLEPIKGSEQGGTRPVLIIQNNLGNKFSPTTIVSPITSKIYEKEHPTNVEIKKEESGLKVDSTILLNQIRTIDKKRLVKKLGSLNLDIMNIVDLAIKISLAFD
ncbi:MAG: type II toxin-antitoxin system PemK/MazF family toxin [Nanoarchaeota archaeon]|nr:type II toxin-antitoxin system PemK/MazF family toxin [Nanoarchaeota archaeon]